MIINWICVASSGAQTPADNGPEHLSVVELKPNDRSKLFSWRDGKPMGNDADKAILDRAAKWYIYRLTWTQFQKREPVDSMNLNSGRSCSELMEQDFYPLLVLPDPKRGVYKPNDNQLKYMQEFVKSLIPAIETVLKNPRPIARINATLVLVKLSESGQEQLAKPLVAILADKDQIDPVKLLALKALRNVFAGDPAVEKSSRSFIDRELELACIQRALDFVTRNPEFTPLTTKAERDAFHYTRRLAIRTLGESRLPVVVQKNQIKARTAYELFRIARNDNVAPAPKLSERIEAAKAICQLQSSLAGAYQVDYALNQLGQFFVELADLYEKERLKEVPPGVVPHPWKYYGALLSVAVQTLMEDPASRRKGEAMLRISRGMFDSIAAGGEASGLRELRLYLKNNPSTETTLYKNDESSSLKSAATEASGD